MTKLTHPRGRRQREKIDGGRKHSYRVTVSPEEAAVLLRRAAEQRITVSRLLMESALTEDRETHTQRQDLITEVFALRRLVTTSIEDLRELVRRDVLDDAARSAAAALIERKRLLAERMDAAVDMLAAP